MQEQPPFFSILIPVYNTGTYLKSCLGSIGTGFGFPVEILITDDGSAAETRAVLDEIEAEDPRVRVLHHEKNSSLYEARRTGVAQSAGKYVLFLDSDDSLAENALVRLHDALEKDPVDVLAFSYRTLPFNTVTQPQAGVGLEQVSALIREKNAVMPMITNKVYSGDMICRAYARLRPGYVNMSEDAVQSVAIAFEAKTFAVLDGGPIYLYQYDTGMSTSSGLSLKKFEAILRSRSTALKLIRDFLAENAPDLLPEADGMEKDFLRQTVEEQIGVQMPDELRDAALLM